MGLIITILILIAWWIGYKTASYAYKPYKNQYERQAYLAMKAQIEAVRNPSSLKTIPGVASPINNERGTQMFEDGFPYDGDSNDITEEE